MTGRHGRRKRVAPTPSNMGRAGQEDDDEFLNLPVGLTKNVPIYLYMIA